MKVAIIGSGNVGKALARSSVRAGHTVTMSSANPDNAAKAAESVAAQAARSNVEAVQGADIVIVAVRTTSSARCSADWGRQSTRRSSSTRPTT